MENEELNVLTETEKNSIDTFKVLVAEVVKFRSKGTAVAASRARKAASQLAKELKVIRQDIQDTKKANADAKKAAKA